MRKSYQHLPSSLWQTQEEKHPDFAYIFPAIYNIILHLAFCKKLKKPKP